MLEKIQNKKRNSMEPLEEVKILRGRVAELEGLGVRREKDQEEIKETKEELVKRIWALKKTNETLRALYGELDKKNQKLEKFDKLKSQFVANVSHEFKNPLFVVSESLSIILDGLIGKINTEQEKILKAGKNNVDRLLRLVTDMLDLSKIEAGKMEMRREKFDMAELVNEILTNYEGEILKKEIILKKNISCRANLIWADKDRMSEVIINLLSNAVKYTPSKGNVDVKFGWTKKEGRFEISDTGSGIREQDLGKIFNKFERISDEEKEGTGLGLSITKDIVELHKGKIWAESEFGKGSKFIFVLPKDLRAEARKYGSAPTKGTC